MGSTPLSQRELNYRYLFYFLLISGVALRLMLFWANFPANFFDNHYEPIKYIMTNWAVAPLDACWECHQPPLYHAVSAVIGALLLKLGLSYLALTKSLQFVSCLYGIATLPVVYLILKKLPISDFAKILAFGTLCFLPRHIYMGAVIGNDTMIGLAGAVSVLFLIRAAENNFSYRSITLLAASLLIALNIKLTALALLPAVSAALLYCMVRARPLPRREMLIRGGAILILPLVFIVWTMAHNKATYGDTFPVNQRMLSGSIIHRPGEGNLSFYNFKPIAAIKSPVMAPEYIDSFWTMLYGRMWFDMEPKFLFIDDEKLDEWQSYYTYFLSMSKGWAGLPKIPYYRFLNGSALVAMGLLPLAFFFIGLYLAIFGKVGTKERASPEWVSPVLIAVFVLTIFNFAGVIRLASEFQYYSSMKATLLHCSYAALVVLVASGADIASRRPLVKKALTVFFAILFSLSAFHIATLFAISAHRGIAG